MKLNHPPQKCPLGKRDKKAVVEAMVVVMVVVEVMMVKVEMVVEAMVVVMVVVEVMLLVLVLEAVVGKVEVMVVVEVVVVIQPSSVSICLVPATVLSTSPALIPSSSQHSSVLGTLCFHHPRGVHSLAWHPQGCPAFLFFPSS